MAMPSILVEQKLKIAFVESAKVYTHRKVFQGDPQEIVLQAIDRIAQLIMQYVNQLNTIMASKNKQSTIK